MVVILAISSPEAPRLNLEMAYYRQWIERLTKSQRVLVIGDTESCRVKGAEFQQIHFPHRRGLRRFWWLSARLKQELKKLPEENLAIYSIGLLPAQIGRPYILVEPQNVIPGGVYGYLLQKSARRASKTLRFSAQNAGTFHVAKEAIHDDDELKELLTGAQNYFLYYGYIDDRESVVRTLKAFSGFKKRLRSSMVLVMLGKKGARFDHFEKLLQSYKFRADVVVIDEDLRLQYEDIFSAAYCLLFPSNEGSHFSAMLAGWDVGVPAIVPDEGLLAELGGDAVLPYTSGSYEDLGVKMIQVFQDEVGRALRVDKGRQRLQEVAQRSSLL